MNIKSLTNEELLRVVSPDTELEALLFERLADAMNEAEWHKECADGFESHECDCEDQEDRINYLEEVLDENEIEYNK